MRMRLCGRCERLKPIPRFNVAREEMRAERRAQKNQSAIAGANLDRCRRTANVRDSRCVVLSIASRGEWDKRGDRNKAAEIAHSCGNRPREINVRDSPNWLPPEVDRRKSRYSEYRRYRRLMAEKVCRRKKHCARFNQNEGAVLGATPEPVSFVRAGQRCGGCKNQ